MINNNKNNIDSTIETIINNNKNNDKQLWHHLRKMQTVFSHLQGGNEVVMRW